MRKILGGLRSGPSEWRVLGAKVECMASATDKECVGRHILRLSIII